MSTGFDRLFGVTQGRIKPSQAPYPAALGAVDPTTEHGVARLGDYVFCLGSDLPGDVREVCDGDTLTVTQTADLTGIILIRFQAKLRPPATSPTHYVDTATGLVGPGGGSPPPLRWLFQWGVDLSFKGQRLINPAIPRVVTLLDGAIDVSQITGVHDINFRLAVAYP